jgi:hypothetical protein
LLFTDMTMDRTSAETLSYWAWNGMMMSTLEREKGCISMGLALRFVSMK